MYEDDLDNEVNEVEFKGSCIGVGLSRRDTENNDNHVMINIMVEDDEHWYTSMSVSSYWLDETIQMLQMAKKFIKNKSNCILDDEGFKFKK